MSRLVVETGVKVEIGSEVAAEITPRTESHGPVETDEKAGRIGIAPDPDHLAAVAVTPRGKVRAQQHPHSHLH